MNLSILFWFYKDVALCMNRLEILRKFNPNSQIFGLYGGRSEEAEKFAIGLGRYLDDFYVFEKEKDSSWKWYHGDIMIAQWYRDRGRQFNWDTIVIVQWDMLLIGAIGKLFSSLNKDEVLLSGLRPVREVEGWWMWVQGVNKVGPSGREEYFAFLENVKKKYRYDEEPLCCQFVVVCLPRSFLERYIEIENPGLGFLEYKIPIYAQIFGLKFCTNHPYTAWWPSEPKTKNIQPSKVVLNAADKKVSLYIVLRHLISPTGARIFHPFSDVYPIINHKWVLNQLKTLWWRIHQRLAKYMA